MEGGKAIKGTSSEQYNVEDLSVLGLIEGDHLSACAEGLLRDISEADFTRTPPRTNEEIDRGTEVGETSREAEAPTFSSHLRPSAGASGLRRDSADQGRAD